jgi:hypothetical protein
VGKASASSFVFVAAAMRAAARSDGSRSARPPSSIAVDFLEPSAFATASTVSTEATGGAGGAGGPAGLAPSAHDTSAGKIRVATWPGGPIEAATASTASAASSWVLRDVRTQLDTFRATVSMSDWSWASYLVWSVAWSPTMFTIGTFPLRAL